MSLLDSGFKKGNIHYNNTGTISAKVGIELNSQFKDIKIID